MGIIPALPDVLKPGITKTPYFKVWMGRTPDSTNIQPDFLPGVWDDDTFNAHIIECSVTEDWKDLTGFKFTVVDPDMEFIFKVYIGAQVTIDLGYSDLPARIISGYILKVEPSFTQDGRPILIAEGKSMEWDSMEKYRVLWNITINRLMASPPWAAPKNIADGTGEWGSFYDFLKDFTDYFHLKMIGDSTVPKNIDDNIARKGNVTHFSSANIQMTPREFMQNLASLYDCVFNVKNPFLFFYPISFIEASVFLNSNTSEVLSSAQEAVKSGTPDDAAKAAATIPAFKSALGGSAVPWSIKSDGLSFWYKMDNPNDPGTGYNLLSFTPHAQDINFKGIIGVGMDPATAEITTSRIATVDEQNRFIQKRGGQILLGPVGFNDKEFPGEPTRHDPGDTTPAAEMETRRRINVTTGETSTFKILKAEAIAPSKSVDQWTLDNLVGGNFSQNMWYMDAEATVVGDINITSGIPCWIMGMGSPALLKTKRCDGKFCGKWYVDTVTHTVKAGAAYLCKLKIRRFLQPFINPKNDDAHEGKVKSLNRVLIKGRNKRFIEQGVTSETPTG